MQSIGKACQFNLQNRTGPLLILPLWPPCTSTSFQLYILVIQPVFLLLPLTPFGLCATHGRFQSLFCSKPHKGSSQSPLHGVQGTEWFVPIVSLASSPSPLPYSSLFAPLHSLPFLHFTWESFLQIATWSLPSLLYVYLMPLSLEGLLGLHSLKLQPQFPPALLILLPCFISLPSSYHYLIYLFLNYLTSSLLECKQGFPAHHWVSRASHIVGTQQIITERISGYKIYPW